MAKDTRPRHIGSRVEFDGRTGTMLGFAAINWRGDSVPGNWKIVFDDDPDKTVIVGPDDHSRVIDITPKPQPSTFCGRPAYSLELPDGVHKVLKRGAYWYAVKPGDLVGPGAKEFSGINTRRGAIDTVLHRFAWSVDPARKERYGS